MDVLTKMYGLTRQKETLVGNAFIRGISGGERKRLSIAEQMATRCSVNMWDGSTRGLDASSALGKSSQFLLMLPLNVGTDSTFDRCIRLRQVPSRFDQLAEEGYYGVDLSGCK